MQAWIKLRCGDVPVLAYLATQPDSMAPVGEVLSLLFRLASISQKLNDRTSGQNCHTSGCFTLTLTLILVQQAPYIRVSPEALGITCDAVARQVPHLCSDSK